MLEFLTTTFFPSEIQSSDFGDLKPRNGSKIGIELCPSFQQLK